MKKIIGFITVIGWISSASAASAHEADAVQGTSPWVWLAWVGGMTVIAGWISYLFLGQKKNRPGDGMKAKEVRQFKEKIEAMQKKLFLISVIVTFLTLIVGFVAAKEKFGGAKWQDLKKDSPIQVETFEPQGTDHLKSPNDSHIAYNSQPPTSGPHYEKAANYGFYSETIPPEVLVHNLEHGDIVIYYRSGLSDETMGHLKALSQVTKEGSGVLVVPGEKMEEEVIVTAWTKMLKFKAFDEDKLETFMSQFLFQGPEKLPPLR